MNKLNKTIGVFIWMLMAFIPVSYAQYGNEWINFSQKYVKIKISAEGLFHITYNQITDAGLINGTIDPNKFQLFNKGVQVPVIITGSSDNTFDEADKILFYGNTNDGSLDKTLYSKIEDQPNDEVSLFEDNNYYFLTYASTNGLRYNNTVLSANGLQPENFIIDKVRLNFATNYYPGQFIVAEMSLSEYIEGEGYLGNLNSMGNTLSYTLNTPNFSSTQNHSPNLSFYVAGRSNAVSQSNLGNHHLNVSFNGSLVLDTVFRGYNVIRKSKNLLNSQIQTINTVNFSSVNDLQALSDFQAISYAELNYARNLNLASTSALNFKLSKNQGNVLLPFTNATLTDPVILNVSTNQLYTGIKTTNNVSFVVNANNAETLHLIDLSNSSTTLLQNFSFKNINASSIKPYLIITNKQFSTAASDYKNYNDGKSLPSLISFTDDLYNEFYYGFHHPLAIKNFLKWSFDKGNVKPNYLLLLGNGVELSKQNLADDFVPTMGYPPSDNMLSSGLNGSVYEPGILTGRIPAKSNTEILNYLDKVKNYNNYPDSIWRKNLLHISGGRTNLENNAWSNFQSQFYNNAKSEKFGAIVSTIKKNVNDPITENQTARIIKETKQGLGLVSYFGHGASTATEISLGSPSDYSNKEKLTAYIINGCSTADVFIPSNSLAEQFILAKDVGGIAWIGTTSEGVASNLFSNTQEFYKNWFKTNYGMPISFGFQQGIKTISKNVDNLTLAHARQYIYIGDPSLKFYAPLKPDFDIKNTNLFAGINNQNASMPTVLLKLKIQNLGMATADSVEIKITRLLADNSNIIIPKFKIKPIFNTDTIQISLSNVGINAAGNNKFILQVDPDNKIQELSKNNNQAILDLFLPGNGINLIYPINKGIVSKTALTLLAEPDDLFTKEAEYLFELDTIKTFNSSFKKSSGIFKSGLLPKWQPNVNFEEGKVYYWRAKLNLPDNKGGAWSTASFTYLSQIPDGLSISHKSQIDDVQLTNVTFDTNNGKFNFSNKLFVTTITTRGDDASNATERRIRANPNDQIAFRTEFDGLSMVAFDPVIFGKKFSYPSPYNFTSGPNLVNGYTGQFFWDINDPIQVDSLVRYINQIPQNYWVLGLNGYNATINQLPNAAKQALQTLGLSKINLIKAGEPYCFYTKKGAAIGTAEEYTADYTSATPARSQLIASKKDLPYNMDNGSIITQKIGPAKKWNNVTISFTKQTSDVINYSIIGINPTGTENILQSSTSTTFDLSSIDANQYPYIKIKNVVSDVTNQTFPDFKFWRVNYQPLSELTFNPEFKDIYNAISIDEGDTARWELGISNLSNYESDPVNIIAKIIKADKNIISKNIGLVPKLAANTSTTIKFKKETLGFGGKNLIQLEFEKSNTIDLYAFNNTIKKEENIKKDNKEPLVNVTFDGKSIINGEIVSPQPHINISTIDENKFLLLNDTLHTEVYIKTQDATTYKRIYFSSNQLKIKTSANANNKLDIEYLPSNAFDDGIYSLKVRSKDASGNYNLSSDYTIDFEVINKSEITQFYPYPNPFSSSMRFVFTLTGMKIPDDIKIIILTPTGKIVREIFKQELGSLRIGNNISDFSWDGTDQYGDKLANGVYFYKVIIKNNDDAQIGRRTTAGDNLFKKDIGKIYIMR